MKEKKLLLSRTTFILFALRLDNKPLKLTNLGEPNMPTKISTLNHKRIIITLESTKGEHTVSFKTLWDEAIDELPSYTTHTNRQTVVKKAKAEVDSMYKMRERKWQENHEATYIDAHTIHDLSKHKLFNGNIKDIKTKDVIEITNFITGESKRAIIYKVNKSRTRATVLTHLERGLKIIPLVDSITVLEEVSKQALELGK